MKWTLVLLALLQVASAEQPAPAYLLKLSSHSTTLDKQSLSAVNGTVGVFKTAAPVQVCPRSEGAVVKLRRCPSPAALAPEGALGLQGSGSLRDLVDVAAANSSAPVGPVAADLSSFTLAPGAAEAGSGPSTLAVVGPGRWLAFPLAGGNWKLAWFDDSGFVTEDYVPVGVSLEPVKTSSP